MVVRWGGARPRRAAGAVSILDVLPTLVQLAGGKDAPGYGQSLVPALLGEPMDLKRGVLTESYRKGQLAALSTAHERLIYVQDEGRYELYDLRSDPGEKTDRYVAGSARAEALEAQLYAHLAEGVLLRRGLTVQRMMARFMPPGTVLAEPQRFGDALELVGYRWSVAGKTPDKPEYVLSLYWRALKRMKRSWRIAVGLQTGRRGINRDHTPGYGYVPGRGTFPTHQWPVGTLIEDQVVVGRMDKVGVRDWRLTVGVYRGGDRLLPASGALKHNKSGTRVELRLLKAVSPLIWGSWPRTKKTGKGKKP
jgi:hypothetical protein